MPLEAKKRKSRGLHCLHLHLHLTLVEEVSESRLFSSNFMQLALVVFCPLASLEGLVSLSSFSHSSSQINCVKISSSLVDLGKC